MTILGPDGRPIHSPAQRTKQQEAAAVQLRGGTFPTGPAVYIDPGWRDGLPSAGDGGLYGRYGPSRAGVRQMCRALYFSNGLFQAAVNIAGAFLVGDAIRYGNFADPGLQTIFEEFWQRNSLEELISGRLITEWFLDGELAVVFPNGTDAPAADEPAMIGLLDVDHGGFSLNADTTRGATPGDMVSRLNLRNPDNTIQRWDEGEFAWGAHNALWNDPRGWPLAMGAADFAVAYIAMMNMRLNVHHVQQRVLAVYKAWLDPNGVDAQGNADHGVYGWQRKTAGFRRLPMDGGVLPVVVQPGYTDTNGVKHDGVEENIEFMKPGQGAADAATDMKLILRMLGLTMGGLPEHFLGEGGGVTRTTAEAMGLPSIRLANQRQAAFRSNLTRIIRAEAKRRAGPDAKFRVQKGSRRRVAVDLIEFPFIFPEIREESLEQIISRVKTALEQRLISDETGTADLGYDPALEKERLSGQAPKPQPGKPNQPDEGVNA